MIGAIRNQSQQSVIVATNDVAGIGGNVFVPGNTETFTHDADGNLTQDGRWVYEWDGENRLQVARSLPGSPAPERRIEFAYDSRGRRIRQTVWNDRDTGQGGRLSDTLYLYDGWNLLAELNANAGNARVRTYTWGLDVSGSEQGAGGVGGLLQVSHFGAQTTNCFVAFDGNGNVAALVNAADGAIVAQYEYGPFGETLRSTGPMARLNPLRFSTKHQDDETDLLYYGYRYYVPSTGRWLSRDPIGEEGCDNLYGLIRNNPCNGIDILGLRVFVIQRNLVITNRRGVRLTPAVLSALGVGGAAIAPTADYYINNTWHCVLVVAGSCSPSVDKDGHLVRFDGVQPDATWDFQADAPAYNHPARDWSGGHFDAMPYSRYRVVTVVDNDSRDRDVINAANSNNNPGSYDVGGAGRNNCCDWVHRVIGSQGLSYANPNPRPFGDGVPPWWVLESVVTTFIDL